MITGIKVGDLLSPGQKLGTHIGDQTMSDIAVKVSSSTGSQLISYTEVLTEQTFGLYQSRGLVTRADLVYSKSDRDTSPLSCNGDQFVNGDSESDWIILD